jgi:zinc D-Ala-D-Ala carboxypeptidase
MNLTKDFTLEELIHSEYADAHGIKNLPTDEEVYNLTALAQDVLQPVRDILGAPIRVNSGFRCKQVNDGVGSRDVSQHRKGEAADLECPTLGNKALYDAIVQHGNYDQLIDELHLSWVHVSWKADKPNRKQQLKIG